MWPYSGKKTVFSNIVPSFSGRGGSPILTNTGRCNLDKEYYQRLVSPQPGQLNFSANQIADDGRVYRCYGLNKREITDLYSKERGNKVQVTIMKPSKQLHQKNVNRLKVVLSLPAKERKASLSHVTGAIMRNEIVPTETRLQNDAFLSDYVRAGAPKLPPLRRKSLMLAQDMETKLRTNEWRKKSTSKLFSYQHEDSMLSDSGTDTILPAITVDTKHMNENPLETSDDADAQMSSYRHRGALPMRRKSSFGNLYRMKSRKNSTIDTSAIRSLDRKDSVSRTSASISEQFRAVMQKPMPREKSDEQNMEAMFNLNVAGKGPSDALNKALANGNSSTTKGYKARLEYGKNLERNWFKNYMRKQTKTKSPDKLEQQPGSCGLRLDIFYSPEPESDSEIDSSGDNMYMGDDTSIQCGGFSTATAEVRARRRRTSNKLRRTSNLSQEAIIEEENGSDSNCESSESDIEIVLKENQLIQRKTKHKMRKKRQRQMKRYRTFMPEESNTVPEIPEPEQEVPLTDQEIRALRLNLRNKERLKKLRGKRKFLQVANAVYIVAQFKKILQSIRKRKRNIIKKRQQRIAALVAKRMALKETREEDNEEEEDEKEEREPTPKPTLKSQFMNEVGYKLVYEMERLNIRSEPASEEEDTEQESIVENNKKQSLKPGQLNSSSKTKMFAEKAKPISSKFANEVKKVSLEDAKLAYEIVKRPSRYHRRRNSIPKLGRPLEFIVEVPYKPKRKTNKNKGKESATFRYNRRFPSPEPKQHCTCLVHKRGAALASSSHASIFKSAKCQHQQEGKKQRMKKVRVETGGLYRTYSLDNLAKRRPIELKDLLADIDIPAKEIKLQILARKFRRQRRRRQRIRLSPCRLSQAPVDEEKRKESESGTDDAASDDSDQSDYDFEYGAPFVGCGVMWNQNARANREPTWTAEDVDREMKRLTRAFHELKECRYLRLDSFNAAVMARLNETKKRLSLSHV